ncbi:GrpB family protein [Nocardioides limicola]|uniref:GrpB family protein n=1 Tax=Nocardioides limicola TaxID=2803368 RepID=UPI00193C58D8|nr:GrpB family protein [Nocardioides sp. DJM-14]
MIEVVDHDPRWAQVFAAVAADLTEALSGVPVVAIEHVGSTAVPDLPAKPIIDIDVLVATQADLSAAILALTRVGYAHRGDLGIPGRHSMAEPDSPRRNVYICLADSLAVRNHLAVRETLRRDPALRREYAAEKRRLAASVTELPDYVEGKTPILAKILARAGVGESELGHIAEVNRAQG